MAFKWYMALNEAGTSGEIALHTRLAVLSARKQTDLEPHLLYSGQRNEFTRLLESWGVRVVDVNLSFIAAIKNLAGQNKYHLRTVGHWLRTNLCLHEREASYVLYTDVDVVFRSQPDLLQEPAYFSVAPEFKPENWNYFNSGVMLANMEGLRSDFEEFERFIVNNLERFHNDQGAYNEFYRGRWNKLAVEMNWKPYWGMNEAAKIIHFHGPKIGAIAAIAAGRWNWSHAHGKQIGSLFASYRLDYEFYLQDLLQLAPDLPAEDQDYICTVIRAVNQYQVVEQIDLSFTNFRLFGKD